MEMLHYKHYYNLLKLIIECNIKGNIGIGWPRISDYYKNAGMKSYLDL